MASVLSDSEIQNQLGQLPDWSRSGQSIETTKTFDGFVEAIDYVNKLVEPAEAAGHHPDIAVSYNKVTISLTSHDAGGLTDSDFVMAKTISEIE
jgi:4a-hydroxytetrahydrobiopterin dehydratase